jgi:hypothetical protein
VVAVGVFGLLEKQMIICIFYIFGRSITINFFFNNVENVVALFVCVCVSCVCRERERERERERQRERETERAIN